MKKLYITAFLISIQLCVNLAFAQEVPSAKIYVKLDGDTIKLRWIVTDRFIWKEGIKRGYDIYRINLKSNVMEKVNDTVIRALNPIEWATRNTAFKDSIGSLKQNVDTLSMFALAYQFPDETELSFKMPAKDPTVDFGNDEASIMHMFHSIATIYSKEAAHVSGYTFSDIQFEKNNSYEYYLCRGGDLPEKALSSAVLDVSKNNPIVKPKILNDRTVKGKTFLYWNKSDTANIVIGAYLVYRSEKKTGGYELISNPPLLSLNDPYITNKEPITYNDLRLEKNKTYYYKIRAIDIFGDLSDFSEPYRVTEKTLLSTIPRITKSETIAGFQNLIEWEIPAIDKNNISEIYIYRNDLVYNDFKPISKKMNPENRRFIDKTPINGNYYKIMVIGNANDTVWSAVKFINIPDSIAPKAPEIISAICDSLGVVLIKWKHGNEKDLKQINIYSANYKHEEFSRIANIDVDSMYRDTISLGVLNKSVYYKIVAYDQVYNPSPFSNTIEAIRYDTISPNSPIISEIESTEIGISLRWACSSSLDVKQSTLLRRVKGQDNWEIVRKFGKTQDKYQNYTDTTVIKGFKYEYTLVAQDYSGLVSKDLRIIEIQALDNGVRDEFEKFEGSLNKRKHSIKLTWKYSYPGINRFVIYKTVNNGANNILTSTGADIFEYYDDKIGQGNTYAYRIKAIYKDGGESPLSKEIQIQF